MSKDTMPGDTVTEAQLDALLRRSALEVRGQLADAPGQVLRKERLIAAAVSDFSCRKPLMMRLQNIADLKHLALEPIAGLQTAGLRIAGLRFAGRRAAGAMALACAVLLAVSLVRISHRTSGLPSASPLSGEASGARLPDDTAVAVDEAADAVASIDPFESVDFAALESEGDQTGGDTITLAAVDLEDVAGDFGLDAEEVDLFDPAGDDWSNDEVTGEYDDALI